MTETAVRAAFAPARALEPTDAELARVLTRVGAGRRARTARSWRRAAFVVAATLVVLAGGGYAAVPPLRAAIDDVTGTFSGWLGGNSADAPGRPLEAGEQAPAYFQDPRYTTDPRVIAEAGGYKLFAAREPDGHGVEFDLGDTGVGLGEVSADAFRGRAVIVLGPGAMQNADEHGHVPLFGITARSVKTVELTYDSGAPLRVDGVDGGFVLLAEPRRGPHEVIALDASGAVVGRQLVDDSRHYGPRIDWKQYGE
jgi:hypothetical protein